MTEQISNDKAIKFFNKQYRIVDHDGRVDLLKYGDDRIIFNTIPSRREFFKYLQTSVGRGQFMDAFDFWLADIKAKRSTGLIFDPSKEPESYAHATRLDRPFNVWKGWGVTPKKGDCQPFLDFLKVVICAGDENLFQYLLHYLGHLFQKPGEIPEISIVLRGGQGIGKSFFVKNIGKLLHPMHFFHFASNNLLTGRFMEHLAGKLIFFADEAFWAGDKKAEGQLKAVITESNLAVEPKNHPAFTINNKVRLFIASNERWVIPAGLDDRRYCFLDVSEIYKTETPYFKQLQKELDNGGLEALLHYFLNEVDLTGFEVRDVPKTPGLIEQKLESADTVFKFWYEQVVENPSLFEKCENVGFVPKVEVYSRYKMADLQTKRRQPQTAFLRLTRNFFPAEEGPRVKINGKRTRTVILPSHENVKKSLFAILGIN